MRRDDSGRGAGRSGRTGMAEAAALADPAGLYGGTAVDDHRGSPTAGGRRRLPPSGIAGDPRLHRGVLTSGAADQLAALIARAAGTPAGCIQVAEDARLRIYGGWGLSTDWARFADASTESLPAMVLLTGAPVVVEEVLAPVGGAFLGHPVLDRSGAVAGVCSVHDRQPRRWTPGQIAAVAEGAEVAALLIGEQVARYELEQQHRFLDAVLDSLHDGVAACDADGRVVFLNNRMRRLWGETVDAAGLTRADGSPLPRDELGLFRALRGERVRGEPLALHRRAERTRHFLVNAEPIGGPDGRVLGAVQTVQDVTRRRRVERFRSCELAVTAALAEATTVEAAGPAVLQAVAETLGWVHAELWMVDRIGGVARPAARWSSAERADEVQVPAALAYGEGLAGRAWQADEPLWIRDLGGPPDTAGALLRTALAVPVHDGGGPIGVLSFFADSVEDPEDELVALLCGIAAHIGQFVERRRVEDLQRQLARTKSEYLALVGHELRTPLTSISAYTELLREADEAMLVRDGPRLLEVIERNTGHLRDIINELLELAALDAGHIDVHRAPTDLAELVRQVVERTRTAIANAPVEIDTELPAELVVPGDRERLRNIVQNLLAGAVRYSPDGGRVRVTLRSTGQVAELSVSDSARDVPREEREQLFTGAGRFRTARGHDRAVPGSALGLTLSRAVVERHHGAIELVDGGEGTTVLVRLPLDLR